MGIFDKLKYGNTFGRTVSIKDTAVKQYPKETKKIEESIIEEPIIEEPIIEKPKPKKKTTPKNINNG